MLAARWMMIATLLVAVPAQAEWMKIGRSTTSSDWSMDPERMKVVGGRVQAWVRIDASHDRSVNFSEAKQLFSFDCAADKFRVLSIVQYDSYGKTIKSQNVPDYGYGIGYQPVVPDTMVETLERLACVAMPPSE